MHHRIVARLLFTGICCAAAMTSCGSDPITGRPHEVASSNAAGSKTSSSASGSGTSTGSGSFYDVHGCTKETAVDGTGQAEFVIENGYIDSKFQYTPKCVLIDPGTKVVFKIVDGTNFQVHPLQSGKSTGNEDPGSPIGFTNRVDLSQLEVTFNDSGTFPYICTAHATSGMTGAVYVEE